MQFNSLLVSIDKELHLDFEKDLKRVKRVGEGAFGTVDQ
jgi:hypothetical protein